MRLKKPRRTNHYLILLFVFLISCGERNEVESQNEEAIPFHFEMGMISQIQNKQENFDYQISSTLELLKRLELDVEFNDLLTQNHNANLQTVQEIDNLLNKLDSGRLRGFINP